MNRGFVVGIQTSVFILLFAHFQKNVALLLLFPLIYVFSRILGKCYQFKSVHSAFFQQTPREAIETEIKTTKIEVKHEFAENLLLQRIQKLSLEPCAYSNRQSTFDLSSHYATSLPWRWRSKYAWQARMAQEQGIFEILLTCKIPWDDLWASSHHDTSNRRRLFSRQKIYLSIFCSHSPSFSCLVILANKQKKRESFSHRVRDAWLFVSVNHNTHEWTLWRQQQI